MSLCEQLDTSNAMGRFLVNLFASLAQLEREVTAERTSAALKHKASKGEFTGGKTPPYGFRLAADGVKLEEQQDEQKAIAFARQLAGFGNYSLRSIADAMAHFGFRNRNNRIFDATEVRRMLRKGVSHDAERNNLRDHHQEREQDLLRPEPRQEAPSLAQ
jgi:site-specific DNA recombinase